MAIKIWSVEGVALAYWWSNPAMGADGAAMGMWQTLVSVVFFLLIRLA